MRVYFVLFHVRDDDGSRQAYGGPSGDGSFTRHFRRRQDAEHFAKGLVYYAEPARVDVTDVPARVARRWGV